MNRRGFFAAIIAAIAAPAAPKRTIADAKPQTLDAGVYRFAYAGGTVYYPEIESVNCRATRRAREYSVKIRGWIKSAKG